jgi:carboxyl-terminal processing protease
MQFCGRLGGPACAALLLASLAGGAAPAAAQTPAAVTANGAASAAVRPELEAFDAAWNILKKNYVAESASHVDWDALRAELRPRAEAARSADEVRVVIRDMLARIGQSHFAILPAPVASDLSGPALQSSEVGSLGFDVGPVDGHLTVTRVDADGPAARAGVRTGWILSRVSGRSVDDALTSVADADDHVRNFRAWALGTALLRGRTGTSTDLTFLDGTSATTARQITRTPEPGYPVKFGNLPTLFARLDARPMERNGRTIGVISFNVWMTAISRSLDEAIDRFRSSKGIVLDLRGNPGGVLTMIMGVSGYFLDAPMNLGVIKTRDSSLNLVANPRRVGLDGQSVTPFAGPLAILVDSGSYSASEIFTGGMQSIKRARVFGTRTAGGALPAVLERLPGGDVLQYAIGDFTTATGERIEGRGVIPDTIVTPTRAQLVAGHDPVLDAALDWIASQPESR